MSSDNTVKLLVRTPAQNPDESTWGYILRLSACNGYSRPTAVFKLAGMSRLDFSGLKIDCAKLGQVIGENATALRPYVSRKDGTVSFQSTGVLTHYDLVAGAGRVCVACIKETGYMPSWMDLRFIDACPIHKRFLISVCPSCDAHLTWQRPSLLQCACGHELNHEEADLTSDEHCALIAKLVDLVQGKGLGPDAGLGKEFSDMSLSRFLGLCKGARSLHLQIFRGERLTDSERAARMLKNWPRNVYRMIDVLAAGEKTELVHGGLLLRRFASGAYSQVFRSIKDPRDVATLSSVLAAYVPGDVAAAKRALTIVSRSPLVARQPVPRTPVREPKSNAHFDTLGSMEAARRLGMPVSLLRYLRTSGQIEVRRPGVRSSTFSHADIERFESSLLAFPLREDFKSETLTVRQLLACRLRGDAKGQLAGAVLTGSIKVVGRTGPLFFDLVVIGQQAEELRQALRRDIYGGTMSCAEAGEILGYNPTAVTSLCRRGLLRSYRCVVGFRVYPDAIEEFRRSFAGIGEVATEANASPRWIVATAEEMGMEIFREQPGESPTRNRKGKRHRPTARHVFMRRTDVAALVEREQSKRRGEMTAREASRQRTKTAKIG